MIGSKQAQARVIGIIADEMHVFIDSTLLLKKEF